MPQTATTVHAEQEFGRVYSEDGPYDTLVGYRVYAEVHGEDERGRKGIEYWAHNHVFRVGDRRIERMIHNLEAAGNVFNEEHWNNYRSDYRSWEDIENEWDQLAVRERAEAW